jgi:hypothetical protein
MQGSQNRYWSETEPVDQEVDFFISIWGWETCRFCYRAGPTTLVTTVNRLVPNGFVNPGPMKGDHSISQEHRGSASNKFDFGIISFPWSSLSAQFHCTGT